MIRSLGWLAGGRGGGREASNSGTWQHWLGGKLGRSSGFWARLRAGPSGLAMDG